MPEEGADIAPQVVSISGHGRDPTVETNLLSQGLWDKLQIREPFIRTGSQNENKGTLLENFFPLKQLKCPREVLPVANPRHTLKAEKVRNKRMNCPIVYAHRPLKGNLSKVLRQELLNGSARP